MKVNQIVEHKIFGIGEVLKIEEEVDTVVIKFKNSNPPKHFCITLVSNNLTEYTKSNQTTNTSFGIAFTLCYGKNKSR